MQTENIVSCQDMKWIPFEPRCAPIDEFLTKTDPSVLSTLGGEEEYGNRQEGET